MYFACLPAVEVHAAKYKPSGYIYIPALMQSALCFILSSRINNEHAAEKPSDKAMKRTKWRACTTALGDDMRRVLPVIPSYHQTEISHWMDVCFDINHIGG
jgi:hypothetical protein